MNRKKASFSPPLTGASSLLVIFAVLCLTVFALLSLSTVFANQRLSDTSAASVSAYYEADCAAEEILARLRLGEHPNGVTEQNGIYSYSCPISDTQTLLVSVQLHGSDWTILRWQAVSAITDATPTDLPVWNGSSASKKGVNFHG